MDWFAMLIRIILKKKARCADFHFLSWVMRVSFSIFYDGDVPNLTRISQFFKWLQLPDTDRPRMITLCFPDMDNVGHGYGPYNDEKLKAQLDRLDRELGALFEGLKSLDLPISVILVSDHGMADVPKDKLINLVPLTEGISARVVNNGALAHLHFENQMDRQTAMEMMGKRKFWF